jgi:hypothetical protein
MKIVMINIRKVDRFLMTASEKNNKNRISDRRHCPVSAAPVVDRKNTATGT